MAVVKTEKISIEDIKFSLKVSVNADGIFTTTIPKEICDLLVDVGMGDNLKYNRSGNLGFFYSDTYKGLIDEIEGMLREYLSREIIEDKIVIKYVIQTTCSYCLDVDGNIVPNGHREWTKTDDYHWKQGTISQHATSPHPYGFQIYAVPYQKVTSKYKSGKTISEYHWLDCRDRDETFLHWLGSFCAMAPPRGEEEKEIDYTEETAKFFVDLLLSVCQLNEKIKEFLEPDKLICIIESKQKLLGK